MQNTSAHVGVAGCFLTEFMQELRGGLWMVGGHVQFMPGRKYGGSW